MNTKHIYRNCYLLFFIFWATSCNTVHDDSVKPISINQAKNSNEISPNNIPPGGCPDGYEWNNRIGQCEPVPVDYGDINPNTITYNSSEAYFTSYSDIPPEWNVKITPGNIINDKKYYHLELFKNGNPVNETLIIGITRISSFDYTDYYDHNGTRHGQLKVYNGTFKGWEPTYTGAPGGTDYNRRNLVGLWGQCVGSVINQMADGSVIGSAAGLSCFAWGPPCAASIGIGCTIMALALW